MNKEYTKPELLVVEFSSEDIIRTSKQGAGNEFNGGVDGDMPNGFVEGIFD